VSVRLAVHWALVGAAALLAASVASLPVDDLLLKRSLWVIAAVAVAFIGDATAPHPTTTRKDGRR
jgi:hypothetical protein